VVWMAFVVVIVGGAGNIKGTIWVSLFFWFLTTIITTVLDSTIVSLVTVLVMLILLAIRPQGMTGYAED
jgi:branched-subunit amino acid ABC-type transport system permease component